MNIKPIKTEGDYRATLREIEALMSAEPGSPEGERLDVLVTLVAAYEKQHFPMDLPDPVEAIKFVMDQRGLTAKDLKSMIGRSNRVYEILNHKRPLTLKMIRSFAQGARHSGGKLDQAAWRESGRITARSPMWSSSGPRDAKLPGAFPEPAAK